MLQASFSFMLPYEKKHDKNRYKAPVKQKYVYNGPLIKFTFPHKSGIKQRKKKSKSATVCFFHCHRVLRIFFVFLFMNFSYTVDDSSTKLYKKKLLSTCIAFSHHVNIWHDKTLLWEYEFSMDGLDYKTLTMCNFHRKIG